MINDHCVKAFFQNSTMKLLLVLSVFVAFAAAAPSGEEELLHAVDFDAIYGNDSERKATFDCLLDEKTCGDKLKFRDSVVKVVQNNCANCNPEQKKQYDQVIKKFHDDYESVYNEFMKKLGKKA